MPSVTYTGQSFAIDGRRTWLLAASIHYARVPPELWSQRIAAARQAGFNTIATACPWIVHEPRAGRFCFEGHADVARFVRACGEAGLRVILRAGPFVGAGYNGGGLPAWLDEIPGMRLREANEAFLARVSTYFRRLTGEIVDLQVTRGGPVILLQSEHAWTSTNERQAERYLREVARMLRENGINVPLINANDLWQDPVGTIDTWRGWDELLLHVRQLRAVQTEAPRLVSVAHPAALDCWGAKRPSDRGACHEMLARIAQVLAGGAQVIVEPFHGGTNFDSLGGRLAGPDGGFVQTRVASGAPLGEDGSRGTTYQIVKRLVTFASHFGHVFAELDPDYHPIVADPDEPGATGRSERTAAVTIVPQRGARGRVVFIFTRGPTRTVNLLLDHGLRMPVPLGDAPVSWFVVDVDIHGIGRLDYVNICPCAIVDRSIVVLFGPERAPVCLSVNGSPLQAEVPSGGKPLLVEHMGLTFVICHPGQIDRMYHDGSAVYVGVEGLDEAGAPILGPAGTQAWVIRKGAGMEKLKRPSSAAGSSSTRAAARAPALAAWTAAPATDHVCGQSPRFATLEGPETLAACGAASAYGWYRMRLKVSQTGKRLVHLPAAGDRVHLYVDGALERVFGVGPGASPSPFDLRLTRGSHTLVALVEDFGRFADGNELDGRSGIFGHLWAIKPLRAGRPTIGDAKPVDPFTLRGFLAGRSAGQLSDVRQARWSFTHAKKSEILIDMQGWTPSGTWVLNDEPLAYVAGPLGGGAACVLVDPRQTESFRRGRNELRFAPDPGQKRAAERLVAATTIYECTEGLSRGASWSFAKWEPPDAAEGQAVSRTAARKLRGTPCWWRSSFQIARAEPVAWFDTTGLSKGRLFLNGRDLGRYFTSTAEGRAVGPQTRLFLPGPWLKVDEPNELVLFDEHGFDPVRTKVLLGGPGEASPTRRRQPGRSGSAGKR